MGRKKRTKIKVKWNIDRYRYWIGIATGQPACPYCHAQDILEAENVKHGGRHFTCKECGAENHFGRILVQREAETKK
jgi:transposase-like protein